MTQEFLSKFSKKTRVDIQGLVAGIANAKTKGARKYLKRQLASTIHNGSK